MSAIISLIAFIWFQLFSTLLPPVLNKCQLKQMFVTIILFSLKFSSIHFNFTIHLSFVHSSIILFIVIELSLNHNFFQFVCVAFVDTFRLNASDGCNIFFIFFCGSVEMPHIRVSYSQSHHQQNSQRQHRKDEKLKRCDECESKNPFDIQCSDG